MKACGWHSVANSPSYYEAIFPPWPRSETDEVQCNYESLLIALWLD